MQGPSGGEMSAAARLVRLRTEHRDLDAAIAALLVVPAPDQLQVARLKKRKLRLRDEIAQLEDQLIPDIIAWAPARARASPGRAGASPCGTAAAFPLFPCSAAPPPVARRDNDGRRPCPDAADPQAGRRALHRGDAARRRGPRLFRPPRPRGARLARPDPARRLLVRGAEGDAAAHARHRLAAPPARGEDGRADRAPGAQADPAARR